VAKQIIMKVYLQYKYGSKDSPYFKYLIENPPKGIEYLNIKRGKDVTTNSITLNAQNSSKNKIKNY